MANNTLTPRFSVVLPAASPGWGVAASLQQLAGAPSTSLSSQFPSSHSNQKLLRTTGDKESSF